jgi:hypothetical protein
MRREALILKNAAAWHVRPLMPDLDAERARFGWDGARRSLTYDALRLATNRLLQRPEAL